MHSCNIFFKKKQKKTLYKLWARFIKIKKKTFAINTGFLKYTFFGLNWKIFSKLNKFQSLFFPPKWVPICVLCPQRAGRGTGEWGADEGDHVARSRGAAGNRSFTHGPLYCLIFKKINFHNVSSSSPTVWTFIFLIPEDNNVQKIRLFFLAILMLNFSK